MRIINLCCLAAEGCDSLKACCLIRMSPSHGHELKRGAHERQVVHVNVPVFLRCVLLAFR